MSAALIFLWSMSPVCEKYMDATRVALGLRANAPHNLKTFDAKQMEIPSELRDDANKKFC